MCIFTYDTYVTCKLKIIKLFKYDTTKINQITTFKAICHEDAVE